MSDGIVIAGGGLAGQRCCETLRARGFDGPIRMVCAEPLAPYDRPPLSKELLAGEPVSLALRPGSWYVEHDVDLLLGTRATGLDVAARRLELSGRAPALRYDRLLIATGAAPRALPLLEGYENAGPLRTLADARRLESALRPGARLAVVGAGFIGLEVAATARAGGAEVTLIEAAPAPLAAVLGKQLGSWFADLHREEGVEVLVSEQIESVRGGRHRVRELVLASGRRVACDHVLVGVGVDPAARWLAGSGLDPAGIAVDECGRTGAPDVYAAGDASRPYDRALGRHVRTEHWEAAARQGAAAARAMLGLAPAAAAPASFWSDQYGVRVQYVGYAEESDRAVTDGDPASRDFQVEFTRAGTTVGVLLAGRPRGLADARRRVQAGLESLRPSIDTTQRSAA